MAELAVSAALVVLVEIVKPLLENHQVEDLQEGLQNMESWLGHFKADMEDHPDQKGSRMFEDYVYKVRGIAYDIEDVLDEFLLHSPPYTFHNHRISRKVHYVAHQFRHGFPLNAISEKIERIRRSINDLKSQYGKRFSAYGNEYSSTRPSSNSTNRVPHPPLPPNEEMVGYEKEKKIFIRQLVDGEKRVVTLAVVGPGGSGKTTFVENISRKRRIRGRFDCHAWVHVSQHFKEEECKLFDIMLKQFCDSMKEPYPIDDGLTAPEKLQKYLTGKRFILVLDDIWRQKDWDFIKGVFPKTSNGSRIIVTTRSDDVASICVSSNPSFAERHQYRHELTRLETHKASTLFYKKAFPDSEGQCPPELKDWSERIIARFEGLPLAIVAAGGALSLKPRLPDVWERFHNSLGRDVMSDSNLAFISNSLLPSYLDLSSNLKSCFLYFSIFPKDYSVERGRLIRLWVAEQFAVETDDLTAEQVAVDYLDQLIQMNLVDVSNWDFDGRMPRNSG